MQHAFVGSFSGRGRGEDREQAFATLADGVVAAVIHGSCP
jgi:hypothetical protein